MYKILKIGDKEYKLEYSIEASLYNDCVKSVMNTLVSISGGTNRDISETISGMSDIPKTTIIVFYAGLIQYHGNHPDGDGSVPDLTTAKRLVAQCLSEHKEDECGNFYGIFNMCLMQMEEDGFFELTGLAEFINEINGTRKSRKTPKKPTDHQKKATVK